MDKSKNLVLLLPKVLIHLLVFAVLFIVNVNNCKGQSLDKKVIALKVIEVFFNKKNTEEANNLFSENYVFHHPFFTSRGLEAAKNQVIMAHNALSGLHINTHEIMSEKNMVVSRFTTSGKHIGEFMGVPATGKSLKITGIMISRFEDGKIVEEWEFADIIGVYQQLSGLASLEQNNIISLRKKPEDFMWGPSLSTKTNSGNHKKNKIIIRNMVDNLLNNMENKENFSDYFLDNFLFHAPSLPYLKNIQDLQKFREKVSQTTKNVAVSIDELIGEQDLVAIKWSAQCIHSASNKDITVKGIVIFKIADGKIEEGWLSFNLIGLLQQIGLFPTQSK
jgi:steroid delta-isomerase-like uncharacterized protein